MQMQSTYGWHTVAVQPETRNCRSAEFDLRLLEQKKNKPESLSKELPYKYESGEN